MVNKADKYSDFVAHPRYGRSPKFTGLNPGPMDPGVSLHWRARASKEIIGPFESPQGHPFESILVSAWLPVDYSAFSSETMLVPNTAILADTSKQTRATIPVTHYFDLEKCCRNCKRHFIFFAEEQKYWYEELGFSLESDCVHCVECRKNQQRLALLRKRYERLFHTEQKSDEQLLELAECCIVQIEEGVFTPKRLEFARMLLNKIDVGSELRKRPAFNDLLQRSRAILTP